ncbi:MFS transporter [Quisquiliibacterium transsilvanicum]
MNAPSSPPAGAPTSPTSAATGSRAALASYGLLRMPLALLELPLFVFLPALYGGTLGVDLATVGAVLFFARLLDAGADPLIGRAIDRSDRPGRQLRWIRIGLPGIAVGFAAMLLPPVGQAWLPAWLAATSLLTYLAYSAVSIAYQAWGAGIGATAAERARVTAVREGFGLVGVLLAAGLIATGDARALVAAFVCLSVAAAGFIGRAPAPARPVHSGGPAAAVPWRELWSNRPFRWLLAAFVLNGVATAMPATLVLFFVRDVLGGSDRSSALFLGAYFLAGAAGMPLWVLLARRVGLRNAWLLGIAFAVLAFVWALGLGRGDLTAFFAVCLLTGLALGSDLAIPPALLAGVIVDAGHRGRGEGSYFGLWSLATKGNLAVAAGIGLPMLGWLGYAPGQGGGTLALSLAYAALPCALKLAAGLVLVLAPLPDDPRDVPSGERIR